MKVLSLLIFRRPAWIDSLKPRNKTSSQYVIGNPLPTWYTEHSLLFANDDTLRRGV